MKINLGIADSIIIATALRTKSKYLITNNKGILRAKDLEENL